MLINNADSSDSEFFCCNRLTVNLLKRVYQKALNQDNDLQLGLQLLQFQLLHMDLGHPDTGDLGTSLGALVQIEGIERKL